jgi:hypothetical protein
MKKINNTICVGLLFLMLASLSRWFLRDHAIISEDIADGVLGLLYGLSFGCMLLGMRRGCRTPS